jgi:hypothetical protein
MNSFANFEEHMRTMNFMPLPHGFPCTPLTVGFNFENWIQNQIYRLWGGDGDGGSFFGFSIIWTRSRPCTAPTKQQTGIARTTPPSADRQPNAIELRDHGAVN